MKDDFEHNPEMDPEPLTRAEWIYYGIAFIFLSLELGYMWTWCQWFTDCPRT